MPSRNLKRKLWSYSMLMGCLQTCYRVRKMKINSLMRMASISRVTMKICLMRFKKASGT